FVISVMMDEPQGKHQGGSVAAPVFNLIAEAALGDLVIPPDDKAFRDALVALSKKYESQSEDGDAQDGNPPPNPAIEVKAATPDRGSRIEDRGSRIEDRRSRGEEKMTSHAILDPRPSIPDSAPAFVMPDLRGRGVRAVTQACAQMNLVISLHGSGLAVRQSPVAGAKVRAGETCKVEFQ